MTNLRFNWQRSTNGHLLAEMDVQNERLSNAELNDTISIDDRYALYNRYKFNAKLSKKSVDLE